MHSRTFTFAWLAGAVALALAGCIACLAGELRAAGAWFGFGLATLAAGAALRPARLDARSACLTAGWAAWGLALWAGTRLGFGGAASLLFCAGAALMAPHLARGGRAGAGDGAEDGLARAAAWAVAAAALVLAVKALGARWYPEIRLLLPLRHGAYDGVPGAPFTQAWRLGAAGAVWAAALGAGLWLFSRAAVAWWEDAAWFALGLAAKLAASLVATDGLASIARQVEAMATAFYRLAMVPDKLGAWQFVLRFNEFQPYLRLHGETHPFGPELVYLGLARLGRWDPLAVGLLVCCLTALTVPLVRRLAGSMGGVAAGRAAAMLYLSSPASLVLSASGIDSTFTLLVVAALAALWPSLRDGKGALGPALAGLAAFAASLLSLGAAYLFALAGLLALAQGSRPGGHGLARALRPLGAMAAAFALAHAALWASTGGRFCYAQAAMVALPFQAAIAEARPAGLWLWLDAALLAAYAGIGLAAGFAEASRRALGGAWGHPLWAALALAAAMALLQGGAHGEVQRLLHFTYPLAAVAAALWLVEDNRAAARPALCAALVALNFMGAALLQALVIDYW